MSCLEIYSKFEQRENEFRIRIDPIKLFYIFFSEMLESLFLDSSSTSYKEITKCSKLAKEESKNKYNWIGNVIHWEL